METLQKVPHWLLKFTGADWDAAILKMKFPDLDSAPELGKEARLDRDQWPGLPQGTIDAGGPADQPDEPVATVVERLRREYWLPVSAREQRSLRAIDRDDWYCIGRQQGLFSLDPGARGGET